MRSRIALLACLLLAACGGPAQREVTSAPPPAPSDSAADAGPATADAGPAGAGSPAPDAGAPGADGGGTGAGADAGTGGTGADAGTGTGAGADAGPGTGGAGGNSDGGVAGAGWPQGPWAATYGPASALGDLRAVGAAYALLDIDADPGAGNFTPSDVAALHQGGALVISYLDLGSCENYRGWWSAAPNGLVPCAQNQKAWRGSYSGYPNEVWMDLSDPDYQALIVDYVAPMILESGVDGFYFDNLEMVEHGTATTNGPCDAKCSQGGLDLIRKLREKYPARIFIMQNATSDVTRLGTTGGVPFASLLDGISHEEVFAPAHDAVAEAQLLAWRDMHLSRGGRPLLITTEDYVGSCTNTAAAQADYSSSRRDGFRPYATDASAQQQSICRWGF